MFCKKHTVLSNFVCLCAFLLCISVSGSYAQNQEQRFDVYVETLTRLRSDDFKINLWGIESVADAKSVIALKGRVALDDNINRQPVMCNIKSQNITELTAQCSNSNQEDLSLFLIQEGFVSVDRHEVYGTLYEAAYLEAEKQARDLELGVWDQDSQRGSTSYVKQNDNFILATLSLVVIFMIGLAVVLFLMINGFRRVLELQNKALNLRGKDQALRHKEKAIVATMIYSEINENKEKIGAYLTIHEDMLKNYESSNHKKLGDIIQKQPVLSRSVFDGNTGKLEIFGERLASEIIHYYARIKTRPDYVEVTPETPREEVFELISHAVENAAKLLALSDLLLDSFEQHALIKKKADA